MNQPTTNNQSKQVQQTLFQDAMDPTRFLRIKEEKDKTVICRIFFGHNRNELTFIGTAEFSKRLFEFAGGSRVGFNPARDPEPPRAKVVRTYRDRDEEEDY